MLQIEKLDHVGIRVRDRDRAVAFYAGLGFRVQSEGTFEKGHPVIMQHPSGVVINLLGPAVHDDGSNILMDAPQKRAGYTHMALRVASLDDALVFLEENAIAVTGRMEFGDLRAVFIRDPDRNVIELDDYPAAQPSTRAQQ